MGAWQNTLGATLLVLTWFGGIAHALLTNPHWLTHRATTRR
jgi:hypothetical protein